jgi:MYXO-CTERM domain-containing protein
MRRFPLFLLVLSGEWIGGIAGIAGCIGSADEPVTERRSAFGEPTNGFPSALERLGLMAINRARSDPQTVKGAQSASYPARPPVIWSAVLNQSARFHANSLGLSDVTLMHPSPCTLNTNVATSGCTGDPSCACASPVPATCASCAAAGGTTTCGTDPFVRIGYFTSGSGVSANGEVAAAGYGNPMTVVDGWMDEAAGNDGHRKNLTDQGISSNTMGYGHQAGSGCFSTFDVSDSGKLTSATIPKIPTAAVSPASGAAGTFTFFATWADPALGAPSSLNVVIDGVCTALTREIGTDTLNATYKGTAALTAGCHNYWIAAKDASGAAVAYPTTGAITLPVGGTACSSDYLASAPAASCAGNTTGGGGMGGAGGVTGAGGTVTGAGGASGSGGQATGGGGGPGGGGTSSGGRPGSGGTSSGGQPGSGGAGNSQPGSGGTGATGGSTGSGGTPGGGTAGGCACDVGTTDLPPTGIGLLLLAALTVRRRRARV